MHNEKRRVDPSNDDQEANERNGGNGRCRHLMALLLKTQKWEKKKNVRKRNVP